MKKLILASGSPRRAKILAAQGVPFEVVKTSAPEVAYAADPVRTVTENALAKGLAARKLFPQNDVSVLSSDTIVWRDGHIYGKPCDVEEARRFLRELSGRTHAVYTGVAFDGDVRVEESRVTFRALTDRAIDDYIARVHPLDRAGAYDIDTEGDRIIARWEGSYENIMGLPLAPLRAWGLIP